MDTLDVVIIVGVAAWILIPLLALAIVRMGKDDDD